MSRPLLLDLFCGAGGAATGYAHAGFDIIGVDINPQPHYPFQFIQADALAYLARLDQLHRPGYLPDAIHASPPCQHHTALAKGTNGNQTDYPELIAPTRELLKVTSLPYVIENVATAELIAPVTLCGETFNLDVIRHRGFESNVFLMQPPHLPHRGYVNGLRHGEHRAGPYRAVYGTGGGKGTIAQWRTAMGIDWMTTKRELAEAIPPAYTQYIGGMLLDHIKAAA